MYCNVNETALTYGVTETDKLSPPQIINRQHIHNR